MNKLETENLGMAAAIAIALSGGLGQVVKSVDDARSDAAPSITTDVDESRDGRILRLKMVAEFRRQSRNQKRLKNHIRSLAGKAF